MNTSIIKPGDSFISKNLIVNCLQSMNKSPVKCSISSFSNAGVVATVGRWSDMIDHTHKFIFYWDTPTQGPSRHKLSKSCSTLHLDPYLT